MSNIKAGDIPHEIQRDVIGVAVQSAANALRSSGEDDPEKAVRQVVEVAVAAWQIFERSQSVIFALRCFSNSSMNAQADSAKRAPTWGPGWNGDSALGCRSRISRYVFKAKLNSSCVMSPPSCGESW